MRLDDYLKEQKISQTAFGGLLSPPVTQSLVSQWIRGTARVTLEQALQIEAITAGAVTPKSLAEMHGARQSAAQNANAEAA